MICGAKSVDRNGSPVYCTRDAAVPHALHIATAGPYRAGIPVLARWENAEFVRENAVPPRAGDKS